MDLCLIIMSIIGYCFSIEGLSHTEKKMPCQDSSGILIKDAWRLAVVADGVGSCKYSDVAAKLAVQTASKVVNAAFPYYGDEDFLALIRIAMHSAENAIESFVLANDGELQDYQTTLAMALYNGNKLYYGNAGDSGIIALDEFGTYHVLSSKQNNEYGEVHTLAERNFEIGKADFCAAGVLCMTDGLLDWIVPGSLSNHKYPVHVPRASIFLPPSIWKSDEPFDESEVLAYRESAKADIERIVAFVRNGEVQDVSYGDLTEGNLKDDLSAAVLINCESLINPDDIEWAPLKLTTDELYLSKWRTFNRLYKSVAKDKFINYIREYNPAWTDDIVSSYAEKIWEMDSTPLDDAAPNIYSAFEEVPKTTDFTNQMQDSEEQDSNCVGDDEMTSSPDMSETAANSKKKSSLTRVAMKPKKLIQKLVEKFFYCPDDDYDDSNSTDGGSE